MTTRFFSLLSFFVCIDAIGNMCLLIYAWSNIVGGWERSVELFNPTSTVRDLSALGSLCTWIGLMRYFGHSRRLSLVTTTLYDVSKPILWTIISILPIFVGFALMGVQLFGSFAPSFASMPIACSSLWALMVGDEVNATFRQVTPVYPFIGRIYIFSFIGIFFLASNGRTRRLKNHGDHPWTCSLLFIHKQPGPHLSRPFLHKQPRLHLSRPCCLRPLIVCARAWCVLCASGPGQSPTFSSCSSSART